MVVDLFLVLNLLVFLKSYIALSSSCLRSFSFHYTLLLFQTNDNKSSQTCSNLATIHAIYEGKKQSLNLENVTLRYVTFNASLCWSSRTQRASHMFS